MSSKVTRWMRAAAPVIISATLAATLGAVSAEAKVKHHRKRMAYYRPLTVAAPAPAYNPYGGPAPLITTPVAVAGQVAGAPFYVLGNVFPARGDISQNPLVLVGAPLHLAGQFVQLPFYGLGRLFGANPAFPN